MLSPNGSPKASGAIFRYHDISIIEYYKEKALGLLNYYSPAINYHNVKKLANYHLVRLHSYIKSFGERNSKLNFINL
jgi:hypothetical protein